MPYFLASIDLPPETHELDTGDYHVTLARCLEIIGWEEKSLLSGELVDGRYHGLGVGCFVDGGGGGFRQFARIELKPGGRVAIYVGSASVG